jgi:hypothetical protein
LTTLFIVVNVDAPNSGGKLMQSIFSAQCHRNVKSFQFVMILLGIMCASGWALAQPRPAVQWTRVLGGNAVEQARAVRQTPDGGYLVAGFVEGTGGEAGHAAVIKLNGDGEVLWSHTFGNPNNSWFFALDVYPDGGFVVVGITMTEADNYEALLVRATADGTPVWTRTFGGWMNDQGYAVTITADGGCAVAGLDATMGGGRYLAYLVKLNADGVIQWQQAWGVESINVEARSVHQCADGGFIISGGSVSYGEWNSPFNMFVVRTNADGDALWTRQYGGRGNEFATDAICLENGDFMIVGYTTSRGAGQRDLCMMRVDSAGNRIWSRTYGGPGNDAAFAVARSGDGGFILGGYTSSLGRGGQDLCLMKTNLAGVRQWVRTYGSPRQEFPWSNQCFQPTADGAYILTGTTCPSDGEANMLVVKTGRDLPPPRIRPRELDDAGEDVWIDAEFTDFDEVFSNVPFAETAPNSYAMLTNYPNPFNPTTQITFDLKETGNVKLQIFNIAGQLVTTLVSGYLERGHHMVDFDGSTLPSGAYICAMETNGLRTQLKMMLLK